MIVINYMTLASFVRFKRLQQWAHDLFSYSNVHCFLFSWFKCSNKIMLMIYLINYLTSFIRWGEGPDWLKLEGAHDRHRLHDEPGEETGVISSYWDLWMICLRKKLSLSPIMDKDKVITQDSLVDMKQKHMSIRNDLCQPEAPPPKYCRLVASLRLRIQLLYAS